MPAGTASKKMLALPLFTAGLLILSFPPYGQGYLTWVAFIPLLWFCRRLSDFPSKCFKGGLVAGFVFQFAVHLYLLDILSFYLSAPWHLFLLLLLSVYLALPFAVFAVLTAFLNRCAHPWWLPFWGGAAWVSLEYLRSLGFFGHTGGFIGYSQWACHPLLNLAATYGYWGFPFIIVAVQVLAVSAGLLSRRQLAAAVLGLGLFFVAGITLPEFFPVEKAGRPLPVALQQGNISHYQVVSQAAARDIYAVYRSLNLQAAAFHPDLIVMPETIVSFYMQEDIPGIKSELSSFASKNEIDILYGVMSIDEEGNKYNSVCLAAADGREVPSYHKLHLVPFAEFFPWTDLLNRFLKLPIRIGVYTPGDKVVVFHAAGVCVGAVVCFESYFSSYPRLVARAGAEHLFVLTNDSWFNEGGLLQHAQVAAIRAAETGIGVTQVANAGIIASFDYRGRRQLWQLPNQPKTVFAELELHHRSTPYKRFGDLLPLASLPVLAASLLLFLAGILSSVKK